MTRFSVLFVLRVLCACFFLRIPDAHDHRCLSTFIMQNLKESHINVLVVATKAGVSCMYDAWNYVLAIRQEFQTSNNIVPVRKKVLELEQSKQKQKGSERGVRNRQAMESNENREGDDTR